MLQNTSSRTRRHTVTEDCNENKNEKSNMVELDKLNDIRKFSRGNSMSCISGNTMLNRRSSCYNVMSSKPSTIVSTSSRERRLSFAPSLARCNSRKFSLFSFNQPLYLGMENENSKTTYENTYRLEENTNERFRPKLVQETAKQVLDDILDSCKYVPTLENKRSCLKNWSNNIDGGGLAKLIVKEVQEKIKTLGMKRHKLVVNAVVSQAKGQGLRVVSRCLWDSGKDGHVTVQASNSDIHVIVIVHGLHYE